MAKDLKENATHISSITGKIREATSDIPDSGVAGLQAGEVYYDTNDNVVRVWDGTNWRGVQLTTSTSTSTTTTSTSTTTTSTSTTTTSTSTTTS